MKQYRERKFAVQRFFYIIASMEDLLDKQALDDLATGSELQAPMASRSSTNPTGYHAFANLKRTVISQDLCLHCGICVPACPEGVIAMSDLLEDNLPKLVGQCVPCSRCTDVCPGAEVNFPALNDSLFGQQPESEMGNFREAFVGHANQSEVRKKGTAGGVVTQIIANALNTNLADGALIVGRREGEPWRPEVHLVRNEADLRKSARSVYSLVPVLEELADAVEQCERLVVVALPCQVQAIRKLQAMDPIYKQKIVCVIGLYCGVQMYFEATRSLLNRFGIQNDALGQIKRLDYRAGDWPGQFEVELHDGTTHHLSKAGFNFLYPFFAVKRCWQCIDPMAELSDISVGDGWSNEGKDTKGSSVVVARTISGQTFLDATKPHLSLEAVTAEETIEMHSHTLSLKKTGSFIRLALQAGKQPTPNYHLPLPSVTGQRAQMERLSETIMSACRSPLGRKVGAMIPLPVFDTFFILLRKVWQRRSKKKHYPPASVSTLSKSAGS